MKPGTSEGAPRFLALSGQKYESLSLEGWPRLEDGDIRGIRNRRREGRNEEAENRGCHQAAAEIIHGHGWLL
jgi:hypothetical protein